MPKMWLNRARAQNFSGLLVSVSAVAALAAACGNAEVPSKPDLHGGANGGGATGNGGSSGSSATGGTLNINTGGEPGMNLEAKTLVFDPPSVTLLLDSQAASKTAQYSLIATLLDGTTSTVTARALEFDRPDLAAAKNGSPVVLTATGAVAGTGTLHAVFGGLEATATIEVKLQEKDVEGNVPGAVVTALDGPGLAQDPKLSKLLYPYDQTVFALGLTSPLLMWAAPNPATDVYRIHVEQKSYSYDLYQAATAPGQLRIPQAAWDRITASNTGDKLVFTLYRYDATAQKAYQAVTESFIIAPESLRGAIYYWTASAGQQGMADVGTISRIYPGGGAAPEPLTGGQCMGCHSVSADGSTLVVDVDDRAVAQTVAPYDADGEKPTRAWASFELPAADAKHQTTMYGGDPALTPDGKYVVFGGRSVTDQGQPVPGSKNLTLAVTKTGQLITNSGLDDIALAQGAINLQMPSFSLDGTKLAAVEALGPDSRNYGGDPFDNVLPNPNRIVYLDFDQAGPKFDPVLHEIVNINAFPAGNRGLGYPAFTPDNKYVAYHTGSFSTGCHDTCDDAAADGGELWLSAIEGGAPIRLTQIDDPPNMADRNTQREPTLCPVQRGGYSWVVFTSMRDWGNQLTGPVINGKRRLWVAAVDAKVGMMDPSHPAFFIEGQADTPNMRGFWALSACIETPKMGETGRACAANFECCSGFCVDHQCVDRTKLSCAGVGNACAQAADCCNAGATDCIDQHCEVPAVVK